MSNIPVFSFFVEIDTQKVVKEHEAHNLLWPEHSLTFKLSNPSRPQVILFLALVAATNSASPKRHLSPLAADGWAHARRSFNIRTRHRRGRSRTTVCTACLPDSKQ
jgi:hypothetical protein